MSARVARALHSQRHLVVVAALAVGLTAAEHLRAALLVAAVVGALVGLGARAGLGRPAAIVGVAAALAMAAGAAVGAARLHAIDGRAARARPGDHIQATAVVLEHPRPSRFGSSAALELRDGRARGAHVLARARAKMRWPAGGEPGTIVAISAGARAPVRSAGSDFDWPAYLHRRGIAVELELDTLRGTGRRRGGVLGAVDAMRRRAERALSAGRSPPDAALMRGMVLGQDEAISDAVRDDFRATGLAHLLAVSGQNVMLLAALALPLLAALGAGPRARALALVGLIAVYVPLAGAGPSLQRAGATGAAGALAMAAGRPASRWYALGLAVVVTLAINPRATADPGWQLSFAAVAGILLLGPPLREALGGREGRLARPLAEGVAVTLAATIATAPLLAHHFGSVSLAGLVANLIALPAVAPIMWSGMTAAALAQLPALAPPLAAPADALTHVLGVLDGLLLDYLRWIAERFAQAPGATAALPLRSPLSVVAAYGLIAAAAGAAIRAARRAEPTITPARAAWRRTPMRTRTAAVAVGLAAATLALVGWTGTPDPPSALTVSFLDIGQGDSTLIQVPGGIAVLFDGGPPEGRVTRLLHRAGVRRLALVVATHQSRDHHGGLQEVVEKYPVDTLLQNGDGTRDQSFWRMVDTARRRGARVIEPQPGQTLTIGAALRIHVYGPPPRPPGPPPDDPNPRAITAVASYGSFDLFLSGDAESDSLAQYADLPDVDAMKVSHHGSADPGLPRLLQRLRPQVAAIEVGQGNPYGHPTASTLGALHAAVPRVYRTDQDGTVRVTVDGDRMAIETGG